MKPANVPHPDSQLNGALGMARQKAAPFAKAARAPGTRRVYARAWADWAAWCKLMHTPALPASGDTVAAYLADRARG